MIEIHLNQKVADPKIRVLSSGVTQLEMNPSVSIDAALDHCSKSLSEDQIQQFKLLYTARGIPREFTMDAQTLVIRLVQDKL